VQFAFLEFEPGYSVVVGVVVEVPYASDVFVWHAVGEYQCGVVDSAEIAG